MLRLAVAQFPVSADIDENLGFMLRQLGRAARVEARLVHFPEGALTGYAGADFTSFRALDWAAVARGERAVAAAASAADLWVVFGSYRRARGVKRPFNCLRVVSPDGEVVATYDKCALYAKNGEARRCSAGTKLRALTIDGVRCGLLICNDSNRESLYARYRRRGVELLIHSYYNARSSRGKGVLDAVLVSQLRTRAFDHGLWISASNSSARYSRLAASVAAPDGSVTGLRRHATGLHLVDVPLPAPK